MKVISKVIIFTFLSLSNLYTDEWDSAFSVADDFLEQEQVVQSVGLALKNLMGLVCDPVAGLVISPCIKRNAIGVMNAFLAAEMRNFCLF